jgi:hypothetical protein
MASPLSPEQDKDIEAQDKNRKKRYDEFSKSIAKKIADKTNDEPLNSAVKVLKEQQEILKEQFFHYPSPIESHQQK